MWSRGPGPFGTIQACSPVLRSMAVIRSHGGLTSGSPRGPSIHTLTGPCRYRNGESSGASRSQIRIGAVIDGT